MRVRSFALSVVLALLACGGAAAQEEDDLLEHVQVGQTYTYQLQDQLRIVYEVKAVEGERVTYEQVVLMDSGDGYEAISEAEEIVWDYADWAAEDDGSIEGSRHEEVTLGDVTLTCFVYEEEGSETWIPIRGTRATFPGVVKSIDEGQDVMILIEVKNPE
jgi:hypothetical protein